MTHGGFGSALLDVLLGLSPCGYQRFEQQNCAFSRILLTRERTRLRFSNSTDHLPSDEIT